MRRGWFRFRTNRTENTPFGLLIRFVLCGCRRGQFGCAYVDFVQSVKFEFGIDSVGVVLYMSGDIINSEHIVSELRSLCSVFDSSSEKITGASESPLGPSCIE